MRALAVVGGMGMMVPAVAEAQQPVIVGEVRDVETGAALAGVEIRLQGTGMQATTDSRGRFRIIVAAPGTFEVEAARFGYAAAVKVVRVGAGDIGR
ncbi:MAG: carboxypeptidase-like regulatory domain-containing protein, partial [Gemmatimonadota bacterium]|nr:carboxypeptidase-like regulatory domain-containing protein [Gemmatimonadota bacterium]